MRARVPVVTNDIASVRGVRFDRRVSETIEQRQPALVPLGVVQLDGEHRPDMGKRRRGSRGSSQRCQQVTCRAEVLVVFVRTSERVGCGRVVPVAVSG